MNTDIFFNWNGYYKTIPPDIIFVRMPLTIITIHIIAVLGLIQNQACMQDRHLLTTLPVEMVT